MTRFYTDTKEFLAVRFCGDAKATLYMSENQKTLLFDASLDNIFDDCGRMYSVDEFMRLFFSLPHAREEEMMRRFGGPDISPQDEFAEKYYL